MQHQCPIYDKTCIGLSKNLTSDIRGDRSPPHSHTLSFDSTACGRAFGSLANCQIADHEYITWDISTWTLGIRVDLLFLCYLANELSNLPIWWLSKLLCSFIYHFSDVIMGAMASQIISLTIVYLTVYSGEDQRKHQSSASLAFVRWIHRWPVNSPHKWPVTREMFSFDDVIMYPWDNISVHLSSL